MTLADTILGYLQDQTPENFLAVRAEVAATPRFSPYANYPELALPLIEAGKLVEAAAALRGQLPGGFLSPTLHDLLARIHGLTGNQAEAARETYLALAVLHGIMSSGDGSEAQPYCVLQVGDEYDTLRRLGKVSRGQSMVLKDSHALDRHDCTDGSVVWFDLTPAGQRQPALPA